MKFNTTMPKGLKPFYQHEIFLNKEKLGRGHIQEAWRHLERAHCLIAHYRGVVEANGQLEVPPQHEPVMVYREQM